MTPIDELNERFAIVSVGNKVVVMQIDPGKGGSIHELWSFEEFKKLLIKRRIQVKAKDGSVRTSELAVEWLRSKEGNQYGRLVYAMPGSAQQAGPNDYNGWRGFTIEPQSGDWSTNRDHLFRVICNGNQAHFEWLLNWCAALVQQPGRHAMSSIVLRGGQGIGKGHFADKMIGRLFHAQQYLHMIGANQLTAEFNEHLSGKVLVFADEATWGGDPRHAAKLKGLVTEDNVPIHRKFLKMVEEPSALHIIVASNGDWPVPADWDDRRFFVLDVSDERKQDETYFSQLLKELRDGGHAAMLYDLLQYKLDDAALRHPPDTAAKRELKRRSLSPEEQWLIDWLMNELDDWDPVQVRSQLHERYSKSMKGNPKSVDALGQFFKTIFKRAQASGVWPQVKMVPHFGGRARAWVFPPLLEFRQIVETALGISIEWS